MASDAVAMILVALPPRPHLPVTDADDLGRLPPQLIFVGIARKIASFTFIARSTTALG